MPAHSLLNVCESGGKLAPGASPHKKTERNTNLCGLRLGSGLAAPPLVNISCIVKGKAGCLIGADTADRLACHLLQNYGLVEDRIRAFLSRYLEADILSPPEHLNAAVAELLAEAVEVRDE